MSITEPHDTQSQMPNVILHYMLLHYSEAHTGYSLITYVDWDCHANMLCNSAISHLPFVVY